MDGDIDKEEHPLGFPIQDTDINVHMKKIPRNFLPKFHGLRSEDLEIFSLNLKLFIDLMVTY